MLSRHTLGICVLLLPSLVYGCGGSSSGTPVTPSTPDSSQLVFRDDFSGTSLDGSLWRVPEGLGTFYGRSQVRGPLAPPGVSGGMLHLAVDTFNPTAATIGDSLLSAEIVSRRAFSVNRGLILRANVRVNDGATPGLVAGAFFYGTDNQVHDEIDTELPTTLLSNGQLLTNIFVGAPFTSAGQPVVATGASQGTFIELEIDWLPASTTWKVNGRVVREIPSPTFTLPMAVHFNFWVPDSSFGLAYSSQLQPATRAADNKIYLFDIDFVEVRML